MMKSVNTTHAHLFQLLVEQLKSGEKSLNIETFNLLAESKQRLLAAEDNSGVRLHNYLISQFSHKTSSSADRYMVSKLKLFSMSTRKLEQGFDRDPSDFENSFKLADAYLKEGNGERAAQLMRRVEKSGWKQRARAKDWLKSHNAD